MAKDPLANLFEGKGKNGSGEGFGGLEETFQEYRVELVWIGVTAVVFGALYVAMHRSAVSAGAIVYAIWVVLLAFPPSRRAVKQSLTTSGIRRRWDKAVQHCGFRHTIPLKRVERVAAGHRAQIRVGRGVAFVDLDRKREQLKASMGIRDLKFRQDVHNAQTGTVTFIRQDPLADVAGTSWPGSDGAKRNGPPRVRARRPDDMPPPRERFVRPQRPTPPPSSGGGIWTPIPVGIEADHGEEVTITMPHRNLLIGGSPGAGKSSCMAMPLATAALDPEVKLWLIDGKMVEFAEWEDCAEGFAHRASEANFMLERLQGHMDRRYQELRALGKRNIEPDLHLPLHMLFVDELSLFTSGGEPKLTKKFVELILDIVARGRAAGFIVVAATQKPESTVVPTILRDLFAYRWALSCGTPEASDTILGRGWASRGFDAATIAPGEPGVGYLRAEDGIPVKLRGYYNTDDDIRALAARAKEGRQHPWSFSA